MDQRLNPGDFKKTFIGSCLHAAILQLQRKSIYLTAIEEVELENFIRIALVETSTDHLQENSMLYESRLVLLMDFTATHLHLSTEPIEKVLESLCPWHPWY
jgi:hypothetical protein